MPQHLIILGAGVHEVEMVDIVDRCNAAGADWRLLGLVSTRDEEKPHEVHGVPVLGGRDAIDRHPDAILVPGNSWTRHAGAPRDRLTNLIDPTCFVSRTAKLGVGCVLFPHCYVGHNVRAGDHLFCLAGSVINHDDTLGDGVCLASRVSLAGAVAVEDDAYLGQACTVRQFLRVGRRSLVGMGSVVTKDVPPRTIVAGNPARRLRQRD